LEQKDSIDRHAAVTAAEKAAKKHKKGKAKKGKKK
jgi:hypothetical protein